MNKSELNRIGLLLNCKGTGRPGPCPKPGQVVKSGKGGKRYLAKSPTDVESGLDSAQSNEYRKLKLSLSVLSVGPKKSTTDADIRLVKARMKTLEKRSAKNRNI